MQHLNTGHWHTLTSQERQMTYFGNIFEPCGQDNLLIALSRLRLISNQDFEKAASSGEYYSILQYILLTQYSILHFQ